MHKTVTETPTIKPELLPADLGGGHIQFIKRGDYAKRTADTLALKWKAQITRAHVIAMLDGLDKGLRSMPDETPKELVDTFQIVIEDYDAAITEVKRLAQEEQDKKEAEEKAKKEKAEREEKLVVSVKDKSMDLSTLTSKFDTGNMDRFIARGKVSDEDLLGAFNSSMRMDGFTSWMQGDLVLELEKRGLENVVSRLAEQSGKHYSQVYNNAKTAKAFPPDTRRKGVSFTVYSEIGISKFTEEQKKELPALIKEVEEGKHTSQSVREAVKKIKGTATETKLPEEDEKREFILIDPGLADDPKNFVTVTKGFPKELVGGGLTIIDKRTGKMFTSMSKKPENRWEDLPEYVKPEEKKEEEKKKGNARGKRK